MAVATPTMQELLEAGVHFGHKVSRGHPRMKPYIFGAKEGVHILDLAKTEELLKAAVNFAFELGKEGKTLLVVGTKKQAQDIVLELAQENGTFYINQKWVGGLLTNFDELRRNINKLSGLKKEQLAGELKRYTKKEQLLIARKLEKFNLVLGGVVEMTSLPGALFVIDAVTENISVKEANRMNIPVIAFADTNSDPHLMDYPVPSNDDGIKAIKIVTEAVVKAYGQGRKLAGEVKAAAEAKAAKEAEQASIVKVDGAVAEETAVIEEEIEKKVLQDSERKVS